MENDRGGVGFLKSIVAIVAMIVGILLMFVVIYAVLTATIALQSGGVARVEIKPTVILDSDQIMRRGLPPDPVEPKPDHRRPRIGDVGATPEE